MTVCFGGDATGRNSKPSAKGQKLLPSGRSASADIRTQGGFTACVLDLRAFDKAAGAKTREIRLLVRFLPGVYGDQQDIFFTFVLCVVLLLATRSPGTKDGYDYAILHTFKIRSCRKSCAGNHLKENISSHDQESSLRQLLLTRDLLAQAVSKRWRSEKVC